MGSSVEDFTLGTRGENPTNNNNNNNEGRVSTSLHKAYKQQNPLPKKTVGLQVWALNDRDNDEKEEIRSVRELTTGIGNKTSKIIIIIITSVLHVLIQTRKSYILLLDSSPSLGMKSSPQSS